MGLVKNKEGKLELCVQSGKMKIKTNENRKYEQNMGKRQKQKRRGIIEKGKVEKKRQKKKGE